MTGCTKRILVVDDAPTTLEVIERNLASRGYQVFTAPSVMDAIGILETAPMDLVITDYKMPKVLGTDLVRHIHENYRDIEVIMITGYPSVRGAVEVVKMGAEEYLAKPFTDEELFAAVERALDKRLLRMTIAGGYERTSPQTFGIIGESAPTIKVLHEIEKAAASPRVTVLILGESGTGKELVARAIHYSSERSAAPFIPVNCGAIPEKLIESELFEYLKGAFTGATESRAGFFQTADKGTIFLDEVNEMSTAMQVKLLRVLQDKEVFMVGSRKPQRVDIRIVASCNKDLLSLVSKGLFREDLYFRLNVISITAPPLRERQSDIPLLISHFASKFAQELGKPAPHFSDDVLQILMNYDWPGNIRELENLIQRLAVMIENETVDVPDLPPPMRFSAMNYSGPFRSLASEEADYIRRVLSSTGGNKSRAAAILGIDRKTLREKLKQNVNPSQTSAATEE